MKIEMTNERPVLSKRKNRGAYINPVREFIESDKKFIVFKFNENDKLDIAKNSIYMAIKRLGYIGKISMRSSKRDMVVYLEKKSV